ncbi:MAG TPA: sodium:solute symporter [Ignavibacteriaceae bacterium]|nr:sodium:solute symporter [Ignavibacteriaceae bacterium]
MTHNFGTLDGIVIIGYLVGVLMLGFYYSRRSNKSMEDYFLTGRNLTWLGVGMSLFATNISSEHFVGLAGSGASRGLAVGQFELMAIFILIILGWFLSPIYIKSGVVTMPEFIEKRYDSRSRKIFTIISIVVYLFTKVSVTLFAGGILFYKIFGINIYASAIIIVLMTGIYSVIGGSYAVMKTQIVQAFMMLLGAFLLTIYGLAEVGGFSALQEKLPTEYFQMFKPIDDPDVPWTGIIFGAPIIAFWYWCADQYIVQRVLSARSIDDARRGSLLAAFLKITPIFVLVLPGMIAYALFPGLQGDEAFPILIASNILPAGIKGFVLAAVLAAVMSSLASVFNSTASLITNDFYKPKNPTASEEKLVLVGRLSTMVIVVTAIMCVPLVKLISSQLYLYMQNIQATISPPITAVFIFGLFLKKANAKGALWTLIIGELIGLTKLTADFLVRFEIVNNPSLIALANINFLHFAIFSFIASSFLLVVISYMYNEKAELSNSKLQLLFSENIKEIGYGLSHLKTSVLTYRVNVFFSIFILMIIIGLWSLWF